MPQQITSRSNPWFRRFQEAVTHHEGEIVLEGPKQIGDAIALGWRPLAVGADHDDQRFGRAFLFSSDLFSKLTDTVHSQGVLALFPRPASTLDEVIGHGDRTVVALDGVQDPGNVGTIVRLAAAFDAGGVALAEGCADPWGQKAIRASAGAALLVPLCSSTRSEIIATAADRRIPLFVTVSRSPGGAHAVPPGGCIVVFGSEGRGVSEGLRAAARPLSIPMSSRVESLNVAAAAAILLAGAFARRR